MRDIAKMIWDNEIIRVD